VANQSRSQFQLLVVRADLHKGNEKMSELALYDAVPELQTLALNDEQLEPYQNLVSMMTSAPEGAEEANTGWRAEIVKIYTGTTTDAGAPGDAKKGDIWSAGEILWSEHIQGRSKPWMFVPVYYWPSRARFRKNEKTPSCRSIDGKTNIEGTIKCEDCPDLPFRNGARTDCQNAHNFVVVPLDLSGLYHISFSKTSSKAGTNINKVMRTKKSLWSMAWGLTTQSNTNDGNTWHTFATASFASVPLPAGMDEFCRFVSGEVRKGREKSLEVHAERVRKVQSLLDGEIPGQLADTADEPGFEDSM
jgi:hypothetical protein